MKRLFDDVWKRFALALPLLFGCESTTFVDCPTFGRDSCLETDACRYRLYGDGNGECRNTCDPLSDDPCPDGFDCELASYWSPGEDDVELLTDLCVD
jgi:hypothetical protein